MANNLAHISASVLFMPHNHFHFIFWSQLIVSSVYDFQSTKQLIKNTDSCKNATVICPQHKCVYSYKTKWFYHGLVVTLNIWFQIWLYRLLDLFHLFLIVVPYIPLIVIFFRTNCVSYLYAIAWKNCVLNKWLLSALQLNMRRKDVTKVYRICTVENPVQIKAAIKVCLIETAVDRVGIIHKEVNLHHLQDR